jgi:stage II sporulation protein AA (anti-sigma F factor antagonist)
MAFSASLTLQGTNAVIDLEGELDSSTAPVFRSTIERAVGVEIDTLMLEMSKLEYMSSAGLRGLVFASQKMGAGVEIVLVNPNPAVAQTIQLVGLTHSVTIKDRVTER